MNDISICGNGKPIMYSRKNGYDTTRSPPMVLANMVAIYSSLDLSYLNMSDNNIPKNVAFMYALIFRVLFAA